MVPAFQQEDWITGLELGIGYLAEQAGPPPEGQEPQEDLPDVLE